MHKKFLLTMSLITLTFSTFTSAISYEFSHFPVKNMREINSHIKNGYDYLRYEGNTSFIGRQTDISKPISYIKDLKYFKFLKFGHYWKHTLGKIKDDEIDLDYLEDKKLAYPVIGVYSLDYTILFIHRRQLESDDRKEIGEEYYSENLHIKKEGNWYITKVETYEETGGFNYKASTYTNILKKLNEGYTLVRFQMGQNPFNKYDIEGYTDNFLQVEIKRYDDLEGLILSLKKIFSLQVIPTEWQLGDKYKRDEQIMNKLLSIYDNIKKYHQKMGGLPQDLGSLNPNFLDISALNRYSHQITYEKTNYACYEIGFKPKSQGFKRYFGFEINNQGFRTTNLCIY